MNRARTNVNSASAHLLVGRLGAFTLIELLLTIVIFAVILASINAVFFGAMRLRQKSADASVKALPLELTLSTLRRDLAGIVKPGGTYAGILDSAANIQGLNEQNVGTEIFTTSGVFRDPQPWAEIQKVAYVLRDPTNRLGTVGRDLVRVVKRNLAPAVEEQPEEQRLLSEVNRIDFSFYDGTSWRTSWNSTNDLTTLPRAIRVEITLEPERLQGAEAQTARTVNSQFRPPIQLVVPVMVATVTNQTASAEDPTGGAL